MKALGTLVTTALFALLAATQVSAQQPGGSSDPHHPSAPSASPSAPAPAPAPGMHGGGMPMMHMCRQMMGEMPGMGMMGGPAPADPKERAAMLEMRGEMMKSMGDIMMKHARRMQGMKGK